MSWTIPGSHGQGLDVLCHQALGVCVDLDGQRSCGHFFHLRCLERVEGEGRVQWVIPTRDWKQVSNQKPTTPFYRWSWVIPLILRFRTYLPSRTNHRTTYQTKIIPLEPMVLIHRCVSRTIFWKYIQDTDIHDCSGRLKQSCLGQDKNLREWEKTNPSLTWS
jgi:hypothetical protein